MSDHPGMMTLYAVRADAEQAAKRKAEIEAEIQKNYIEMLAAIAKAVRQ